MKRLRGWSVRTYLVMLVLLAVIPAFALALYNVWEFRRDKDQDAREKMVQSARSILNEQERLVEAARALLTGLAEAPGVRRYDVAACGPHFASVLKQFPYYTNLFAAKPNGDMFCSGLPMRGPVNLADRAYFRRALETRELTISEYLIGRTSGKANLTLAYPVVDAVGVVRVVLAVGLDYQWLSQWPARVGAPPGRAVAVVDSDGVLLARHPEPEKWVGKPAPGAVVEAIRARQFQETTEGIGVDGIPRVFAVAPLHRDKAPSRVWVFVSLPTAEVFAGSNKMLARNLLVFAMIAMVGLTAVAVVGNRFIVRPIQALLAATNRVGTGDLAARSGLPHDAGWLGQLAHAFDGMAESLQARQAEINQTAVSLGREHGRLYSLLDGLPATVFLLAPDYSLRFANRNFRERWGSPDGRRCYEAIHGRTVPCEVCPSRRVFETGNPETWESTQSDGSSHEAHAYPFWDIDGSPLVLELGIDITRRKHAEAEAEQHLEARMQSEKLAVMTELLAGVAHELNNPLSVIVGHAQILRQTAGNERVAKRADKLIQASERCARLVKNFLAIARRHPVERREVQLNDVAREAVELLAFQLRLDNVDVSFNLAEDLPALSADPHQLQQVVVNLVTNAHHALRPAPPPRRLTLTTGFERDAGRQWLEVADSGHGVAAENQARLFEPFFTTKPVGEGTGLGLPICKGIVESHGGTISLVRSAVGEGTVFRVELPVTAAPRWAASLPETEPAAALGSVKVLVVEDEADVSEMLAEILTTHGHEVDTAPNGVVALEALGSRSYDLILSDIRMPELDGPGLYREVVRRAPAISRRFVFLTGDILGEDTRVFIEESGAPTITKPFTADEIFRVMQKMIARGRVG